MVNFISIRELRPNLSAIIKTIHGKFDRYIITKRGRPEVVMMSFEDYESLIETMNIEADKEVMKRIKKAEAEFKNGKGASLDKINKELGIV